MKTKRYRAKKNSRRISEAKGGLSLGDIVQIKDYCSGGGKLGIVVEIPTSPFPMSTICKIIYLEDLDGDAEHPVPVLTRNIEKLEWVLENQSPKK